MLALIEGLHKAGQCNRASYCSAIWLANTANFGMQLVTGATATGTGQILGDCNICVILLSLSK